MITQNNTIFFGDNLSAFKYIDSNSINLVYTDTPFNTGKKQILKSQKNVRKESAEILSKMSYEDKFDDFIGGFLKPRMIECYRVLKNNGALFLHIDYREVHYAKVMLDQVFGRECFINEIIWSYDYGARQKNKWPTKHDTILYYRKNPNDYIFNYDKIDRIPYMAPGLVGKEKAALGKTLTDVWWNTIVPTQGKERTGYPTQKPLKIVERIVRVHSNVDDMVLDCFAGSGTTAQACLNLSRRFVMMDNNAESISTMKSRFKNYSGIDIHNLMDVGDIRCTEKIVPCNYFFADTASLANTLVST